VKSTMSFLIVCCVTTFLTTVSANAQSTNPQETLNQYISDLQKSPNDYALREKIIRHVQTMKKAPAIPEEARRHYVKARTLFEDAKQPSDSADAAEEFRQALLVAPWWGEAYMKMGLALETAQRYDDAIASLKLFMATRPQDEVLRKAQDEIYKIEAKLEKAAKDKELAAKKAVEEKQAQQEDAAAKKAKEQEEFLRKINGARYFNRWHSADEDGYQSLDVLGDTITEGNGITRSSDPREIGWHQNATTYKIDGRSLRGFFQGRGTIPPTTGVISDDGSTITIRVGDKVTAVFKRER